MGKTEAGLQSPEVYESPKSEFVVKLEKLWQKDNFVCVGLDSDFSKIPQTLKDSVPSSPTRTEEVMVRFNQQIVDATHDLVCAYKPNSAFYEAQGDQGMRALVRTVRHIRYQYPEIPVILDAKRADIGNTNDGYVQAAFDILGVDAITVHPFLGKEALKPFLDRKDKGIIVLARTSNPGADEFQDLPIPVEAMYSDREIAVYGREEVEQSLDDLFESVLRGSEDVDHLLLYQVVAWKVARHWNKEGNCGVVVGATYPKELAEIRRLVGDMPILIPGIGAQGGEVEATVTAGKDSRSWGMIVNSSRGIIFASKGADFAEAARKSTEQLRTEINKYR